MAAIPVTAEQRCAADKRASSLMPKHTRAYFVPTPSVVPEELLNHCVWRVLKNTPLPARCISLSHTWTRINATSPITGCAIFKNIAARLDGAKLFCHTARHFGGLAQIVSSLRKSGRGDLGNCWSHRLDCLCKVVTRVVRPRPCERFESQWPGLTSRDLLEPGADRPYCNLINLYFTLTQHSLC